MCWWICQTVARQGVTGELWIHLFCQTKWSFWPLWCDWYLPTMLTFSCKQSNICWTCENKSFFSKGLILTYWKMQVLFFKNKVWSIEVYSINRKLLFAGKTTQGWIIGRVVKLVDQMNATWPFYCIIQLHWSSQSL